MGSKSSEKTAIELNRQMIERLLAQPPQPLIEGQYALRVVQTYGRVTGRARRTPVGVLRLGQCWLVAPDRRRDWVRNLHADPRCTLLAGNEQHRYRAGAPERADAAVVVSSYLSLVTVPWALRAFPVHPTASLTDIEQHMDTMAVFHLDPATHTDNAPGDTPCLRPPRVAGQLGGATLSYCVLRRSPEFSVSGRPGGR